MLEQPLVSIIIPTFNRARLIGETLDSVLAQTYQNWECIVVDDGSTDSTDALMAEYIAKDARFQYHHRRHNFLKGAPSCRNIGLEKAIGAYIIFFDSDDLMTLDHIEKKLIPLLGNDYDFSITKTKYFNVEDESLERYYNFDEFEITKHNYIIQNINWLTLDVCIKSSIAKSIQFNENLKSGQEFNYFSKLIVKTEKCIFIDEYVSLRRKHNDSIQGQLLISMRKSRSSFFSKWETYKDLKPYLSKKTRKEILYICTNLIYLKKCFFVNEKLSFFKELYSSFGFSAFNFIPMIVLRKYSQYGYYFRQKLKDKAFK